MLNEQGIKKFMARNPAMAGPHQGGGTIPAPLRRGASNDPL
jgi:hypothetical protein